MGQKVHPIGFRLGIVTNWHSRWYADKEYGSFVQEDIRIRKEFTDRNVEAGIARIDIERGPNEVIVTAHTARPGIVIGRGGQRVDESRRLLESLTGKKVQLNIQEVREPELDAYLVARNIAGQIEHNVAYRRAMKRAISRTLQAGAKGIKIKCSGRLGGAEIARRATLHEGRVPLHTIRADIDYAIVEAHTQMGLIGVKVWIYRGDVLPQAKELSEVARPALDSQGDGDKEKTVGRLIEVKDDVTAQAS